MILFCVLVLISGDYHSLHAVGSSDSEYLQAASAGHSSYVDPPWRVAGSDAAMDCLRNSRCFVHIPRVLIGYNPGTNVAAHPEVGAVGVAGSRPHTSSATGYNLVLAVAGIRSPADCNLVAERWHYQVVAIDSEAQVDQLVSAARCPHFARAPYCYQVDYSVWTAKDHG